MTDQSGGYSSVETSLSDIFDDDLLEIYDDEHTEGDKRYIWRKEHEDSEPEHERKSEAFELHNSPNHNLLSTTNNSNQNSEKKKGFE